MSTQYMLDGQRDGCMDGQTMDRQMKSGLSLGFCHKLDKEGFAFSRNQYLKVGWDFICIAAIVKSLL